MGKLVRKTHKNMKKPWQDKNHKQEQTFTCEICIERVTPPNKIFKNSNRCVHPFCTNCMIKYIQVKLEDNVSTIQCPAITCTQSLEPLSCRPLSRHQLFNKWCDMLCESAVFKVDRVYCPNKKCSELILNECGQGNLKRCVCPYCKKPFCFGCKVSWHAGYFCEESGVTRDKNDVAFGNLCESKGWKRCPRCKGCIERVSGCNLVTCRCGTTFHYTSERKLPLRPLFQAFIWILVALDILLIYYIFFRKALIEEENPFSEDGDFF